MLTARVRAVAFAAVCWVVAAGPCPFGPPCFKGGATVCYYADRQGCCSGTVYDMNVVFPNGTSITQSCCRSTSDPGSSESVCQTTIDTTMPTTTAVVTMIPTTTPSTNTASPITPTPPSTTRPSSSPLRAIWTVPISAVCVVGACLLVWFIRRRKRNDKTATEVDDGQPGWTMHADEGTAALSTAAAMSSAMDSALLNWRNLELLRMDETQLKLLRLLGTGATGEVWLGRMNNTSVAVKRLVPHKATLAHVQAFVDEIVLLASLDCLYIVDLLGATWTLHPQSLQAVIEYMNVGDLRHYLAHTKAISPWSTKLEWVSDIINGLVYLHSLAMIHRDLKSRNILLDATKPAKLADFGISRLDVGETMTLGVGTCRWMAPEVLTDKYYTNAVDVYSFGVVLSELDTHLVPYADVLNDQGEPMSDIGVVGLVVEANLRPTFSNSCPKWIVDMASQCMANDASERPSAVQIAYILRTKVQSCHEWTPGDESNHVERSASGYLM
ncbi:Aste57867_17277 [Aphanomyces stellatus]|uniref:Aste57867_17277 protein n=1 Tax=Aphanomyces stellatus TaxID=120398 RepID=A0A485L7P4_9STRA|nr:hypothetical protein As57867_017218 [Aphanomyces stellatus]VFT94033.1 Aste57867_17277 [Aphanomyces stellatus]